MKLIINDNEVNITVKGKYSKRANKQDTYAFLNELCCFLTESREMYELRGVDRLAEKTYKVRDDIYNALDAQGYYNF